MYLSIVIFMFTISFTLAIGRKISGRERDFKIIVFFHEGTYFIHVCVFNSFE